MELLQKQSLLKFLRRVLRLISAVISTQNCLRAFSGSERPERRVEFSHGRGGFLGHYLRAVIIESYLRHMFSFRNFLPDVDEIASVAEVAITERTRRPEILEKQANNVLRKVYEWMSENQVNPSPS